MIRMLDQIRAHKLPSNMMQFAARGALAVSADESLEILVYLACHNKVFGETARITLAGWDEKNALAAASNPNTPTEVLHYLVSPENLRPRLLPALLENPAVLEVDLTRVAQCASADLIAVLLKSPRVRSSRTLLEPMRSNPYLKANDAAAVKELLASASATSISMDSTAPSTAAIPAGPVTLAPNFQNSSPAHSVAVTEMAAPAVPTSASSGSAADSLDSDVPEEAVSAYLAEHADEITAEEGKPFQPIGGILDLLGADYFPVSAVQDAPAPEPAAAVGLSTGGAAAAAKPATPSKRENTVQKINRLDVKGRIQLALKGNKEERSILIRDGTKVVAFAVLEAPKLSDGEVEKFALQKNVLEAVLRQIPLKRRFMKNYNVVRNLVSNPRTPLDLSLGLMKHLHAPDLKNISANKEVSETVRSLAGKMFRQKVEAANKK
jgi:hypothetical protein